MYASIFFGVIGLVMMLRAKRRGWQALGLLFLVGAIIGFAVNINLMTR